MTATTHTPLAASIPCDHSDEDCHNQVQACLFNFIVYTNSDERLPHVRELVNTVMSRYPCRVIFVAIHDTPGDTWLRTEVTTRTIGKGDDQLTCDYITIDIDESHREHVQMAILPQILPDLPVYLLWSDNAGDADTLRLLSHLADRIVVDTERADSVQKTSRILIAQMAEEAVDLVDITWMAITGWRNVIAGVFNSPEGLQHLARATLIRITYSACGGPSHEAGDCNEMKAFYIQAWMAAQMNWKFTAIEKIEGNIRVSYRALEGEVVMLLIPKKADMLEELSLLSVEVMSSDGACISVGREDTTPRVKVHFTEQAACTLPYYLALVHTELGQALVNELLQPRTSEHYSNMLQIIAQIPATKWHEDSSNTKE